MSEYKKFKILEKEEVLNLNGGETIFGRADTNTLAQWFSSLFEVFTSQN